MDHIDARGIHVAADRGAEHRVEAIGDAVEGRVVAGHVAAGEGEGLAGGEEGGRAADGATLVGGEGAGDADIAGVGDRVAQVRVVPARTVTCSTPGQLPLVETVVAMERVGWITSTAASLGGLVTGVPVATVMPVATAALASSETIRVMELLPDWPAPRLGSGRLRPPSSMTTPLTAVSPVLVTV